MVDSEDLFPMVSLPIVQIMDGICSRVGSVTRNEQSRSIEQKNSKNVIDETETRRKRQRQEA